MAKQSNLERLSIDERHKQLMNSDYNKDNEYSSSHADALSPQTPNAKGEEKGKGTGSVVGSLPLPETKSPNSPVGIALNTETGGDEKDIEMRESYMIRNLYGPDKEYGPDSVDMSKNIAEGQIVVN